MLALSRTPRGWLWLRVLLILFADGFRALGYLALQDLRSARDELSATAAAISSGRKVAALRRTAGDGSVPRELRPTLRQQVSLTATELLTTLSQTWRRAIDWLMPERVHIEEVGFRAAMGAALKRPGAVLSGLTLSAGLWLVWPAIGEGALTLPNGEVVPVAPNSLFTEFLSAWHPVGFGSTLAAHPLQGLVGLFSLPFGNAASFMRWAMAFSVFAVAMSMHLSLRKLVQHAPTRVWLAALYGFSPPVLQAVVSGDIATVWCAILLPALFAIANKVVSSWRAVAVASFITAIVLAVWPALWLFGWVLFVVSAWQLRPNKQALTHWAAVLVWSFCLLLPWSLETLLNPERWFRQFGVVKSGNALAGAALFGVSDPTHPFNWFWSIGLLTVAVAAWVDRRNRGTHRFLWLGIVSVLSVALVGQLVASLTQDANVQPSVQLASVICVGLLIATLASATGFLRVKLSRSEFGWPQLLALALGVIVTLMPVSSLVSFGLTPDSERLHLQPAKTAEMLRGFTEDLRLRTLWLSTGETAQVEAEILDGRMLWFGDHSVMDTSDESALAESVVAWLTRSGETTSNPLRRFGVGYVAVPFGDPVAKRVAALGGLKRLLTARNADLISVWQVTDVQSRAYIGEGMLPDELLLDVSAAPTTPQVSGVVLPQTEDTVVVLADRADDKWHATINGQSLERLESTELRWRVPAGVNGALEISYPDEVRSGSLVLSGIGIAVLILTLLPRRRRIYQEEWLDD